MNHRLLLLLWVGLGLLLDQALKGWATATFSEGQFVDVWLGVLRLGLIYNTGAAWGLFSGSALPLALLRLGVGLALLGLLWRGVQPRVRGVAFSFIASGALGNALDGLRLGKVVDPLSALPLSQLTQALYGQDFPVFNLADIWVVTGVAVLLVASLLERRAFPAHP